ncbi:MAG: sulfatase [Actinomycetota bacterium]|nr:sulfatase [Actinomycetota bacterium]
MCRVLAVTALVALGALGCSGATDSATPTPERPNILIILTDDQPAQPETYRVMPQTMRLFRTGGTRYKNAVATTPLCCPSRASIFSGRYAHNHGVRDNDSATAFDATKSIQAVLQGSGYQTGLVGKYLNLITDDPPHFDHWATFADGIGGYKDPIFNVNGNVVETSLYSTTFIRRKALSFLGAFEQDDSAPWFLEIAPFSPHTPATPERRYADVRVPGWQTNPAREEKDLSDKPAFIRALTRDDPMKTKRLRNMQLRSLMSVDDLVDQVFSRLQERGEARNTLAFFMSDNGYFWYEHRVPYGKFLPYDEAVKIPFFARWPGNLAMSTVEQKIVANIDVAPTIYDAAGVAPDYVVDGQSIFRSQRSEIFLEFLFNPRQPQYPKWHSLWTPDSSYIRYYESEGKPGEYYGPNDPWQLENRYRDGISGNEPIDEAELDARLQQHSSCVGVECP